MAQLSVFGGVDLREEKTRLDAVLAQPKRTALLVYLAAARPHGFHARDTLLALLWPESDDRRARRSLRKALHFLRKHLGKDAIVSRGDDVGMSARVVCDAAAFDAAVAAGRSREALELYGGEFLKGFHVSGAPAFERWQDAESQRYRRAASRLAWSLAEGEEASGSEIEAIRLARRAHAIQPLEETGIRRLMGLLDRHGDRAGALRLFDLAEKRVHAELGVELSEETRALRAQIARGASSTREPSSTDGASSAHGSSSTNGPSDGPEDSFAHVRSLPPPEVEDHRRSRQGEPREPPGSRTHAARPSGSPRSRYVPAGIGAAIVSLLAIGAFFGLGHSEEPADPEAPAANTIAVLPFAVAGEEEDVWREGMATLLATSLHGAAGFRTREPEFVLKYWKAEYEEAAPTRSRIRAAGRSLNADWVVSGSMTRADGRLRLAGEAWNVSDGRTAGPVVIEGQRDRIFGLVDRLTLELLRDGMIADEEKALPVEISRVTTTSLEALEAYLEGERHWRSARLRPAAAAFARAVRHDSTFALARYRLAIALFWTGTGDDLPHLRAAVRLADRLHDREATLARGWLALQEGRIREGLDTLRELTNRNPGFAEGWLRLGDGLLHDGGRLLIPMSEFRTSLRQATASNPLAAEPYWHLLEDAFFREDSAEAARLVEAYRRVDPYSDACIGYETAYGLAWGDRELYTKTAERLPTLGGQVRGPLTCALSVLEFAPPLRPAFELVARELESPHRPEAERRRSGGFRIHFDVRAGRIAQARHHLRGYLAEDEGPRRLAAGYLLFLNVLAYPDSATTDEAARVLSVDPSPVDQFWLAVAELERGRQAAVAEGVSALRQSADSLRGEAAVQASGLARTLELLRELETAGPEELRTLSDIQANLHGPGSRVVREMIRLRIAEALLQDGEPDEALRYVQSLPMGAFAMNAPAILLEGRAREAMADTLAAQASYTRFLRWYENADPELEPMKEQAREGLRRLGLFDG